MLVLERLFPGKKPGMMGGVDRFFALPFLSAIKRYLFQME